MIESGKRSIGNKAAGLFWLKKHGFFVPPFAVIPKRIMENIFKQNNIDLKSHDACQKIDNLNIDTIVDEFINELRPPYSVRSSSCQEDGKATSGAGRFKTMLSVSKKDLSKAVKEVWKSAVLQPSNGSNAGVLAVIIQEMRYGRTSGVCFTKDPVSGADVFVIETVNGLGDSLVSGTQTPFSFYFEPRDLSEKHADIPQNKDLFKALGNTSNKTSSNISEVAAIDDCSPVKVDSAINFPDGFAAIDAEMVASALVDVEMLYGRPADIEFTVEEDKPVFLQIRPITALPKHPPAIARALMLAQRQMYSFYVKRDFVWLVTSVQAAAGDTEYQSKLFFGLGLDGCAIVNGAEYYSNEYLKRENAVFSRLFSEDGMQSFADKIRKEYQHIKEFADKLECLNTDTLSDNDLMLYLMDFLEVYKKSYAFMLARPDAFLSDMLVRTLQNDGFNSEEIPRVIDTLTDCGDGLLYADEMKDFLLAAAGGDFIRHARKYSWMNSPLSLRSKPFSARDYARRAMDCGDINKLLAAAESAKAARDADKKASLSRLSPKAARLVGLLAEFKYLRTYTAENSDRLFYMARYSVLKEFARRKGVALERVLMSDIGQLKQGQTADSKTVSARLKGKLFVFENGTAYQTAGRQVKLVEAEFRRRFNTAPCLRGVMVCGGRARGKARHVKNCRDASAVEKGEIVIASMLTPDLSMSFFKAAGIVTEEGGITCHAAIIAREYNIPCVTGVAGIMDAVRRGMTIEIDNGIITLEEDI